MPTSLPSQPETFHLSPDQIKLLDYLHDMTQQLCELAAIGGFRDVKTSLDETLNLCKCAALIKNRNTAICFDRDFGVEFHFEKGGVYDGRRQAAGAYNIITRRRRRG